MDLNWSLNELYTSLDSAEFKNDLGVLKEEIKRCDEWSKTRLTKDADAVEIIEEYLEFGNVLGSLAGKLQAYTVLVSSVDAKNSQALKCLDRIAELLTETALPDTLFSKWLKDTNDLEPIIQKSSLIKEHSFYIKELKEKSKYILSDAEEVVISKFKTTGSTGWENLQDFITSTHLVDIMVDGEQKKLPLPAVRNMAYDSDVEVRKNAYHAELKSYEKIADTSAFALNGIKGESLTEMKMRGYESPLSKSLLDSRLDAEALEAMLGAMREYLGVFRKYFKAKAAMLGHKDGLPFYDLFAPVGDVDMRFSYDEAHKYVVENFSKFSKKMGDFADHAIKSRWVDVEPKEGKRGGAFCYGLHSLGECRILTNFTGSFSDMLTLAHELGHGYHDDCLKNERYLNANPPMPIAETASTFCETIVTGAALKTANDKEKLVILENQISGCAQVVVDILSRFIFESKVFEMRKDGPLSSEELCSLMLDAQKETYGDGLEKEFLHPYMWACKPHYYSADFHFYNFPYAFGQLFANGLYGLFLRDGDEFVEKYDKMLSVTGKMKLVDVAAIVDVDIKSADFWRSSLKVIERDIEEFCKYAAK